MSKKRFLHILSIATVILLHVSCVEDVPELYQNSVLTLRPMRLNLSQQSVRFNTYEKSSLQINVSSTNVEWEFTDIPEWIDIIPKSGGEDVGAVTITCEANPVPEDRKGYVTFNSVGEWNYSTRIEISQVRNVYSAIPDNDTVRFDWTASQSLIKVRANSELWTVNTLSDLSSWCSARKTDDGIEISCKENDSQSQRSGHINVSTPDGFRSIVIIQSKVQFEMHAQEPESSALLFSDKAGTASIFVSTSTNESWYAKSNDDWITLSESQGKGKGTINVTVKENNYGWERSGLVVVSVRGYSETMKVIQSGKFFKISSPPLLFGSSGGEKEITFSTNDEWDVSSDCSWISLSKTSGKLDDSIRISVHPNNSVKERNGKITFIPKNAELKNTDSLVVKVEQKARYMFLLDDKLSFNCDSIRKTIPVSTDGAVGVSKKADWLSVVTENNKIILILAEYDGSIMRSDTLTVFAEGMTEGEIKRQIIVTQYGKERSYVDLGLHVKWATCNVGASKSEDYGDYFAWGEKKPKTTGYTWASYSYCDGSSSTLTKYCYASEYGKDMFNDTKYYLDERDDVVHEEWGGNWRTPNHAEFLVLKDSCNWTWTKHNGVYGYRISGKKPGYENNSIFLPASGMRRGDDSLYVGKDGYYWSAVLNVTGSPYNACILYFNSNNHYTNDVNRCEGLTIRPVLSPDTSDLLDMYGIAFYQKELVLEMPAKEKGGLTVIGGKEKILGNNMFVWKSSDESVAKVSDGVVVAVGVGECVVTAYFSEEIKTECKVKVFDRSVDLGLSVRWAYCNVGADNPEDYGDYYGWGEIDTKPTSDYNWSNYRFRTSGSNNSDVVFSKYSNNYEFTVLEPNDDVASSKWGGGWRMPTVGEFQELFNDNNCTRTWKKSENGIYGLEIVSKKRGYEGRSIFLPAAKCCDPGTYYSYTYYGYYWSSSLSYNTYSAKSLYFTPDIPYNISDRKRYIGMPVRPVCPKE